MADLSRKAAIVGVDESNEIGRDRQQVPHAARLGGRVQRPGRRWAITLGRRRPVYRRALPPTRWPSTWASLPKYTDGTNVGGSSFIIHVEHALSRHQLGSHGRGPHSPRRGGSKHPGLSGRRTPTCRGRSTRTPTVSSSHPTAMPQPAPDT